MKENPKDHTIIDIDGHHVPVENKMFAKLEEYLKKHHHEATVIGGIVIFGIAAAATARTIHEYHKKQEAKKIYPPLTPEQEQFFAQQVFEPFQPRIEGFLKHVCNIPTEAAEDLSQNVFLRARNHFADYVAPAAPAEPYKSWLYTIALNLAKNYKRDGFRHPTVPLEEEHDSTEEPGDYAPTLNLEHLMQDETESVEEKIIHQQEQAKLKKALHKLPSEYQIIIWLKTLDFSMAEIKEVFSMRTENAAKAKLHRAIYAFKHQLDKLNSPPPTK